ncbi:hypothetical protein Tco_0802286 [Tanacetum coccineum]|uniref:Uncharacterized protein n=1 Tax=Tanacetum coccineum TaxID=301880 RepID=A0ABQ5A2N6_9ASTR
MDGETSSGDINNLAPKLVLMIFLNAKAASVYLLMYDDMIQYVISFRAATKRRVLACTAFDYAICHKMLEAVEHEHTQQFFGCYEKEGILKFYDICWKIFNALNSLELKSLEEPI